MGLVHARERVIGRPLPGGVSSAIWRIELSAGPYCVKRALPKLKVAADWRVPVERNAYEAAWFRHVADIAPGSVPRVLGEDRAAGAFVMEYLDPTVYPVWKEHLRRGKVDRKFSARVGEVIGRIHAATAGSERVAVSFATDENFYSIRLEPYLVASAKIHPDCEHALNALVEVTARERRALVHGDVSPKNILVGVDGPLFLDAECAWYGDPAFDLAFCLNHLLLKTLWVPDAKAALLDAFDAMYRAYFAQVDWEPAADVERRASRLLAGLMLGRVDGKSPVEYLNDEHQRDSVRRCARSLLLDPEDTLTGLRRTWQRLTGS